jgi:hypothetical protein
MVADNKDGIILPLFYHPSVKANCCIVKNYNFLVFSPVSSVQVFQSSCRNRINYVPYPYPHTEAPLVIRYKKKVKWSRYAP